jgi:hypothetical protein
MNNLLYSGQNPVNQTISTLSVENLSFAKNDATIFVETGTNIGAGVQTALDCGFDKIISIEVIDILHQKSKERFQNNNKVELIFGNSREKLLPTIKHLKNKILFWLDGHEYYDIPLVEELLQIKSLERNDHTILIDDVRMFNTEDWGGFSKEKTIELIFSINPNYKIYYLDTYMGKDDILMASI